jgi:hypothetical protein
MGIMALITEPKRLGWWNFGLWIFFSVYVCYFLELVQGGDFGKASHFFFGVMGIVSVLLSLLIPGATAIRQRTVRIFFKFIIILSFLGTLLFIKQIKFLSQVQSMLLGACGSLGSPSLSDKVIVWILLALAYIVPLFFVVAVAVAGEFDSSRRDQVTQ